MEFKNDFEVENSLDEVWDTFLDVEKVAVCLPGAKLEGVEGDEYKGIIKIKVGPITSQYKGVATMLEQDKDAKKIVIKAEGRDSKGAGNASASITVQMEDLGGKTKVEVATELTVTGKVAQFGRGVMADISAKLMDQFANNLRESLGKTEENENDSKNNPENNTENDSKNSKDQKPDQKTDQEPEALEPEALNILEGSSMTIKVFGNIAGSFMKVGQGIKKIFKKSSPTDEK